MKSCSVIFICFLVGCGLNKEKLTGYKPSNISPNEYKKIDDGLALKCSYSFAKEMNLIQIATTASEMRTSCGLSEKNIITLAQQVFH